MDDLSVKTGKRVVVLGAGSAGTMMVNKLRTRLPDEWQVVAVDRDNAHMYQPGFLFIPVGKYKPSRVVHSRKKYLLPGIDFVEAAVEKVVTAENKVYLSSGQAIEYDYLLIATGTQIRPDLTEGMADGALWFKKVFEFYTYEGSVALRRALEEFEGGKVVVHVTDMPIKCPVAPLELSFLIDDYFRKKRIRHKVDLTYVTPLDGAFSKPVASRELGNLLDDRAIRLRPDFAIDRIDNETQELVGYDGTRIPFDLCITTPLNTGQDYVFASDIGDESGFIPVDKHTLQSTDAPNVFAIGDATNLPTSKAGAVAHFSSEKLIENMVGLMLEGKQPAERFDGHANCFVESGRGQALLLDFNYDTQPLTGTYPLAHVGPMKLLGRSRLNHMGKLAFEKMYWGLLMRNRKNPLPADMQIAGKKWEE
ncbi:MAG: NAD(P)/FAD-dependent oxidoreductase [Eggerthellaceae bacterium]|nr:NAD(P)/FAD-dependent oxidoreductase [Eggerthellaceae bacterium]